MNLKLFFDTELSEHEVVLRAMRKSLAKPFMELCDVAANPLLIVPSAVTARIQEMHIVLGHMMCDILEQQCSK